MTRKTVVYIAGPFRAPTHWKQEQNIRTAEYYALEVWKMGGIALCPHLNSRNFQDVLPDDAWLEGDLVLLEKCDAILMVPNWQASLGARAELQHAERKKIGAFTTVELDALKLFIEARNG